MNKLEFKSFIPTISYILLCTVILLFDFNLWIPGSSEYPRFYIMPIIFSIAFLVILIFFIRYQKKKITLQNLESPVNYNPTLILLAIYLGVIWIPRQFMIWKFFITFEKIPLLYLIVTQIILVEGLVLSDFGLKKQDLLKNALLGCTIAFLDISIMTVINLIVPLILEGTTVFANLNIFEISQFITFPWQLIAVGISEELFFRGYFFTKFRKAGKSFWHSAIVTSLFFTLFHVPWLINSDLTFNTDIAYIIWRVINTFPFGIVCCVLYEKTKSLVAPIVYHGFSNSLTSFILIQGITNPYFEIILWTSAFFVLLFLAFLSTRIIPFFKIKDQIDPETSFKPKE